MMLEAGAHRCLLTIVPLHVPAKAGLPHMYTKCMKNLETMCLCMAGAEGSNWSSPFIFIFCGGHGNYCREQLLLGYDMRAMLSAPCSSRRVALAAGYCAQTNQGPSDHSRYNERLGGPGSSSGELCFVLVSLGSCSATLFRAPGAGNPVCGCYRTRILQASVCTEVGMQEHTLVAV